MLRLVQTRSLRAAAKSGVAARQLHSTPAQAALTKFLMPAMSPTMTEGGISGWKKQEGESFAPGDVLVEVETDKASIDVEAQDEGIVAKLIKSDGSKAVKVGEVIAILAEEGDEITPEAIEALIAEGGESAPAPEEPKPTDNKSEDTPAKAKTEAPKPSEGSQPPSSSSSSGSGAQPSGDRPIIHASPIAKRLALEKGIPLFGLKGTGPDGRIVKADIDNYKPAQAQAGADKPAAAGAAAPAANYTDVPVSGMRRTIAARLTDSKQNTPHYYTTVEINMDRVAKLRELFNSAAKAAEAKGGVKDGVKGGVKLSVNDFIVKAAGLALAEVPDVNAGWHGDFIRQYSTADISIAVATPTGLITPIVTNVGGKGLSQISAETKILAGKARDGKLQPQEYQGGSFTISNLGMFGVDNFTAIINPPQAGILAIGGTSKKLVLDAESEKGFKEIEVMKATLSADHRVVDGAVGAKWLKAFKGYLESPLSFML